MVYVSGFGDCTPAIILPDQLLSRTNAYTILSATALVIWVEISALDVTFPDLETIATLRSSLLRLHERGCRRIYRIILIRLGVMGRWPSCIIRSSVPGYI